ncbi:lantibiotic dehydratase [Halalkalibacterium halodurans]|uniref:Lantibiotic dehydratase N-terminal domain-containing protein n=2 Tax=Halalkalibacterium halodurans TaxID=86665 RepID=A0A0M0KJW9_ALKHA|nr:lantibiotic dehydratase [Halalkalibacterium halodurans]TPE68690.1 hypothetical protein AMD02_012280 [Halalkalibacterium halodurans]
MIISISNLSPKSNRSQTKDSQISKWSYFSDCILRSTGFPAEWIEKLCFHKTTTMFDLCYQTEQSLNELVERLKTLEQTCHIPSNARQDWQRIRKLVGKRKKVTDEFIHLMKQKGFDQSLTQEIESYERKRRLQEKNWTKARESFEAELVEKQLFLQEIYKNPRLQEAIFQQSPSMYKNAVVPYVHSSLQKRNTNIKRIERQLISYLQRLCTKNETTSFFGPIQYGVLTSEQQDIEYNFNQKETERRAFMPYWSIKVLAAQMKECDVFFPYLNVKLSYQYTKTGDSIHSPILEKMVKFPKPYADIIKHLTYENQSIEQLAKKLSQPVAWLAKKLRLLEKKRLILIEIPLSITEPDSLNELRSWILKIKDVEHPDLSLWQERLEWLWKVKQAYPYMTLGQKQELFHKLESTFTEWTGEQPRRLGGEIYADRNLLYEECHGPLNNIKIGGSIKHVLKQDVPKWLSICAKHGEQRRKQEQALAQEIFKTMYPNEDSVPFLKFVRDLSNHPDVHTWEKRWQSIKTEIEEAITHEVASNPKSVVHLSLEYQDFDRDMAWLTSPDLMIAKKDDDSYQVILGEIHDTIMVWGWALQFHPEKDKVNEQLVKKIQKSTQHLRMLNMLSSKRFKIVPFEYPGTTIQMNSFSNSPNEKIPLSQLKVTYTKEGLALTLPDHEEVFYTYNGELNTMVHSFFSLPRAVSFSIRTGESTPRLMLGDLVVQRAKWHISKQDIWSKKHTGSSIELFYEAYRFHLKESLPKEGFAKLPGQPKPVYVNFTSYFLIEMLEGLWPDGENCTFSEMLPNLSELWLSKEDQKTHTAEIRLSYFVERS